MQTRRQFLRDCSLLAITASLAPAAALARNPATRMAIPDGPGLEQFARLLKTSFTVRTNPGAVQLVLVEARAFLPVVSEAEDARNEKFRLMFLGPVRQPLEQDTYWFEHPRLGRLAIFIVPVGSLDTTVCHYEAIFDRPVNAADLVMQLASAPRRV